MKRWHISCEFTIKMAIFVVRLVISLILTPVYYRHFGDYLNQYAKVRL